MTIALPGFGAGLGTPELIIIVLVVLLLFGGKKLPEMARGTGRALRIFKAETKGLMEDDDKPAGSTQAQLPASGATAVQPTVEGPVQEPWPQQTIAQPVQPVPVEQPRTDSER